MALGDVLGDLLGVGSNPSSDPVNVNVGSLLNLGLGGSLLTGNSDPLLMLDVSSSLLNTSGSGTGTGTGTGLTGTLGSTVGSLLDGVGGVLGTGTTDPNGLSTGLGGVIGGLGDVVTGAGGVVTTVGDILGSLGDGVSGTGTGTIGTGTGGAGTVTVGTGASGIQSFQTTGGEVMIGTSGNDAMVGTSGNDHFYPMGGNDTINGGMGYDTVFLTGPRADYTGAFNNGVLTLTDTATGAVDTISNVERLAFTDSTVAFDINGDAGQAYRLYQAALDRTPDQHGLSYWVTQLDKGMSLENVAQAFVNSPEFQADYGNNLSNAAFVNALYQNVLGRASDTSGAAFWTASLANGESRADVLMSFSESPENHANVDAHLANGILLDYGVYV